jgi:electron transport complex protein RnfD
MLLVMLACLPAAIVSTFFFGIGTIINLMLASVFAVSFEAIAIAIRRKNIRACLSDNSALVTAVLLGLAMPPGSPWWLVVIGIFFAIIIGKHVFGGLGQNLFNPAMCGYAMLLLTFPLEMTAWHIPLAEPASDSFSPLSFSSLLTSIQLALPAFTSQATVTAISFPDGFAMATPLIEHKLAGRSAIGAIIDANTSWTQIFDRNSDTGWELVNMAYLAGGGFLVMKKIITWHIPVSIILTIVTLSLLFYSEVTISIYGTTYLHLFGSATMIGAFFIATDPVSAAVTPVGKLVYGIIIGAAIYSIRVWGSYLDSIAFAVLIGNFCAPLIDRLCVPRIYGHSRQRS